MFVTLKFVKLRAEVVNKIYFEILKENSEFKSTQCKYILVFI